MYVCAGHSTRKLSGGYECEDLVGEKFRAVGSFLPTLITIY